MDVQSLREVDAPYLPDVIMLLPSSSLVMLTYALKMPYHLATNTISFVHYYPRTSEEIMVAMNTTGCNYQLPVSFDMSNSNHLTAKEALIRFGVLGSAENYTWSISVTCHGITDINVSTIACAFIVINVYNTSG